MKALISRLGTYFEILKANAGDLDLLLMYYRAETEEEKQEATEMIHIFCSPDASEEERLMGKDMIRRIEQMELGGEFARAELQLVSQETARAATYTRVMARTTNQRRFFRSERGLFGSGLSSVQEGDQIWLLTDSHVCVTQEFCFTMPRPFSIPRLSHSEFAGCPFC